MDDKRLPALAQALLAVFAIGNVILLLAASLRGDFVAAVSDLVALAILWSLYTIKRWALVVFDILLSLKLLSGLVALVAGRVDSLKGPAILIGGSALLLVYFNTGKVKQLFFGKRDSGS